MRPEGGAGHRLRRLVVVRHGRTAWNAEGRAQGHADVPLDGLGHAQAAAAAAYLASLGPDLLVCSDLARARQTCGYVEEATGLHARTDPRLREFDVGVRQGLTIPEFAERMPREHAAWESGHGALVPGAETAAEVQARMAAAFGDVLAALPEGGTAVAVTHGAALKEGLVALLGWPEALAGSLRGMDNCAWASVDQDESGRTRLAGYNESVRPGHTAPERLPDES